MQQVCYRRHREPRQPHQHRWVQCTFWEPTEHLREQCTQWDRESEGEGQWWLEEHHTPREDHHYQRLQLSRREGGLQLGDQSLREEDQHP